MTPAGHNEELHSTEVNGEKRTFRFRCGTRCMAAVSDRERRENRFAAQAPEPRESAACTEAPLGHPPEVQLTAGDTSVFSSVRA